MGDEVDRRRRHAPAAAVKAVLFLAALLARAEVVDSAASGFTVKTVVQINAPPEEVFHKLIQNIGDWWNPEHTFSHDAHNLRIEPRPGGCLCEKMPNLGFVRHFELINFIPGKYVVFSGAMGPLQPLAAVGTMQIQLTAAEGGTKLEMTYAVSGYLAKGLNTWAPAVDMVTGEQFVRLKNFVETGKAKE